MKKKEEKSTLHVCATCAFVLVSTKKFFKIFCPENGKFSNFFLFRHKQSEFGPSVEDG
jgi:predicted RNA-binding Zn-ribbon protein involved in translation (DUF1610 family)